MRAAAAAFAVALLPVREVVATPSSTQSGEARRPFDVSEQDRRAAQKEAERAGTKVRHGNARAALKHYLAALELDPYNATAREGLAALVGPIGERGASVAAAPPSGPPAHEVSAPGEGTRDGGPLPTGPRVVLGRIPGLPGGPIRRTGPSYPLAEPFLPDVERSAGRYGVDARLILGVIRVESNFDPKARSKSGARGLMQLLPETGRRFGARSLDDPAQNIDAGTRYLRYLLDLFHGDIDRALAGYNAGEMSVVRAGGVPADPGVRGFIRSVRASCGEF